MNGGKIGVLLVVLSDARDFKLSVPLFRGLVLKSVESPVSERGKVFLVDELAGLIKST